ncbi:alcohol dehydrogenase [Pseudocercospora fuligena]|uniref:Alcohol dehydrogenase n=1 Tax=Pseudocercospora fuligena TaxID=685502 RepID=A0A8H6VP78_9PEZI|nr:alcohol dehydrogenase [Pseudocercospora fuligena]
MASALPTTVHAWRKHRGIDEAIWEEVPVPSVPPTGFLCKMLAAGVCHSDEAMIVDRSPRRPWFQEKFTLGHEGCGEIIAIGEKVTDTSFKVVYLPQYTPLYLPRELNPLQGDTIAMIGVPGCGGNDCPECSRSLPQLCATGHHSGIGQDGFFAPYASIDQRGAALVPKSIPPAIAAVATDAVLTAYHAVVRRAEVKPHETVFIFGLGGLGFNGMQVCKAIGARVIVSDVREERLHAAREFGVDVVPVGKDIQEFVREKGLEGKIDTTIDFVGVPQTFGDAQAIVRAAGKMVCVGTLAAENTIQMKTGIRKRLSIIFSYGGQIEDLREALDLIAKGDLKPQVETGKLEDFPKWLKDLCDGKVKARVALTCEHLTQ